MSNIIGVAYLTILGFLLSRTLHIAPTSSVSWSLSLKKVLSAAFTRLARAEIENSCRFKLFDSQPSRRISLVACVGHLMQAATMLFLAIPAKNCFSVYVCFRTNGSTFVTKACLLSKPPFPKSSSKRQSAFLELLDRKFSIWDLIKLWKRYKWVSKTAQWNLLRLRKLSIASYYCRHSSSSALDIARVSCIKLSASIVISPVPPDSPQDACPRSYKVMSSRSSKALWLT